MDIFVIFLNSMNFFYLTHVQTWALVIYFAHHYYNDMYSVCMGCVVHGIGVCLAHRYFSLQYQEEDTMQKYLK